jgi:transcriptional regulator with XRE-family HTH domain
MDLKKTGNLISEQRKTLGMTQKELADRLQVTDKAVSRWETGKGFPESSLLQPLAQALELSIAEIVNGERTIPEKCAEQNDLALIAAMGYAKRMRGTLFGVILAIAATAFLLLPLFAAASSGYLCWLVAGALYIWAVLCFWEKWPTPRIARWIGAGCMVAALVLQILPYSAALVFSGPDYHKVDLLSCFDLALVGFANFPPFLSAIVNSVSVLLTAMLLIFKKGRLANKIYILTIVSAIFMALPGLLSIEYLPMMGLLAALLLAISALFQARANG